MAAWDLATAQIKLVTWMAAEDAVAQGQSYEIDVGGNKRKLSRADMDVVLKMIKFWRAEVERLTAAAANNTGTGPKVRYINPI